MAKPQLPVGGKVGKAWKITSPFGWRIHPIDCLLYTSDAADE